MEDIDEDFVNRVKPGDIIMATTNFGCGSSREHAPLAIKAAGVSCIIARSFARIFFRNAINRGEIRNLTSGTTFTAEPYPDFMSEIISAGGLIEHTRKRLADRRV